MFLLCISFVKINMLLFLIVYTRWQCNRVHIMPTVSCKHDIWCTKHRRDNRVCNKHDFYFDHFFTHLILFFQVCCYIIMRVRFALKENILYANWITRPLGAKVYRFKYIAYRFEVTTLYIRMNGIKVWIDKMR